MNDRCGLAPASPRQQAAGLCGRHGNDLDASSLGLFIQLWHDRKLATGAGAHDQPGGRPRDLLVGGTRITSAIVYSQTWARPSSPTEGSATPGSASTQRQAPASAPEQVAIAAMVTAGEYRIAKIVAVWRDDQGRLYVLPP